MKCFRFDCVFPGEYVVKVKILHPNYPEVFNPRIYDVGITYCLMHKNIAERQTFFGDFGWKVLCEGMVSEGILRPRLDMTQLVFERVRNEMQQS